MADYPTSFHLLTPSTISTIGQYGLGANIGSLGNPTSNTWPTANKALFIPFRVAVPLNVVQFLLFTGATKSGNVDVGIYDVSGTRIVSFGSVAQGNVNTLQVVNTTDVFIGPGLFYMALAMDNTTGTQMGFAPAGLTTDMTRMLGVMEMASAFPLPANATFASVSQAFIPLFAISLGGFS